MRTITWGGKPFKSPSDDDDPSELSPRRSFAQWHQVVEGTSDPWTPTDIATAKLIGAAVTDVITAIPRDATRHRQGLSSTRCPSASGPPSNWSIVADTRGQILEANAGLVALLGERPQICAMSMISQIFLSDPEDFATRLKALRREGRSCSGEVAVKAGDAAGLALRVRADPVVTRRARARSGSCCSSRIFAGSGRSRSARRRFQEGVIASRRRLSAPMKTQVDLKVRNLLQQVLENAQLAALEVTDAADPGRVRGLLEGIRTSVKRSAEVLARFGFLATPLRAKRQSAGMISAGGLRQRLRAATREAHQRLHRQDGFRAAAEGRLESRDYRDLLARLYGFYQPFESRFPEAPADMAAAIDACATRARARSSPDDLLAMKFRRRLERLPVCADLPAPRSEAEWLGALYVTEGSTLGGALIARALAKSGVPAEHLHFFAGHGKANASMWISFLARLDALSAAPQACAVAEAAACATFAAFEAWMQDWRGSTPV